MTTEKAESIEQTLIKISLKQLWMLIVFLVGSTFFGVMLYGNIMASQQAILAEVKKNATERGYQIESINKDIKNHENRIAKLEEK